ncbi:putative hydrolase of the HAD superfamily [Micromonospora citrea]|uniref:Putative hydrolase of the HAD superfamily n=1 Tax=Micromonospora citrea TaxID=47855 RepID=A0A1C6TTM8_9ACTN|nr:putative hydrolase of the HAD superfamily [Micromonospora citrea]
MEEILRRHWPAAPIRDLPDAFRSAAAMLERAKRLGTWEDHCRTFLAELGIGRPSQPLLDELIAADPTRVRPFSEVPTTLGRLRERGLSMAVVSDSLDTAESLRSSYERIGLRGYFRYFAVAGELGCMKPDPAIYRAASRALGEPPQRTCYVDDNPDLVTAAISLGYRGLALCRTGTPAPPDLPYIAALDEVLWHVDDP